METVAIFLAILFVGTLLYFLFSDPISFLLFGILIGILIYVLVYFGFVSVQAKPDELDITYKPIPVPSASTAGGIKPTTASILPSLEEVFYIANNVFTYDQAPAVCKAYGGELASYSQVEEAYSRGAEWCGYGWTQGGMALFPTQESTWELLQQESDTTKRTACGRPGINGGYFNPQNKFGVNCYGVKPGSKGQKFPLPVPGSDPHKFDQAVDKFKSMISKFTVSAFNRDGWSEWNLASHAPTAVTSALKKI